MALSAQAPPPLLVVSDAASFKRSVLAQRRAGKLKRLRRPPAAHVPRLVEREYYKALRQVLDDLLSSVRRIVLPRIAGIVAQAPAELRGDAVGLRVVRRDQFDDAIQQAISEVKVQFLADTGPRVKMAARATAKKVSDAQDRDHKKAVQSVLGIRPELAEPWLQPVIANFVTTNARLIEGLSDAALDGVARRIGDGVRSGLRAEQIAEQIVDDLDQVGESMTLKRARFIAEDQVGSLYGDLARVRAQKLGLNRFRWSTSLDERVRESHQEREQVLFDYDRPIEEQLEEKGLTVDKIDGFPGKPPRCRCVGLPDFSALFEEDAPAEEAAPRERPNLRLIDAGRADQPEHVVTTKPVTVSLGDRDLTFERDQRSKDNKRKLVLVRVADLDAAWERGLREFYIPRGGGGAEISGRREGFERFLETLKERPGGKIEASTVGFNDRTGQISFVDGRHRFSLLRDMGLTEIPVAVDADSAIALARALGVKR